MQENEIIDFVNKYFECFNKFDTKSIVSHYSEPTTIHSLGKERVFQNHQEIEEAILMLLGIYKQIGMYEAVIDKVEIKSIINNVSYYLQKWHIEDSNGDKIIACNTSYTVKKEGNQIKIIFVVSHDEMQQILPLIKS